ncbi:MAG: GNAT family N-acetyltransferase [Dokdonella sp.]
MANSNIFPTNGVSLTPHDTTSNGVDPETTQWQETLRNGTSVLIRPIRDVDVELERRFIEELSPQSIRFRFLGEMKTPSPELLRQFTHPDPASEVAFVAMLGEGADKREIGVSRYSARADGLSCECAVAVSDDWHNQGLATMLMQHLIGVARQRGIECMYSIDSADNQPMRDLAEHLGFTHKQDPSDSTQVVHSLDLKAATT